MNKKVLLSLVSLLFLFGGVAAGILLVRQEQTEKKASTNDGLIEASLSPETTTVNQLDEFNVDVMIDPNQIDITAIQIRLTYTFDSNLPQPPIRVLSISENQDLVTNGFSFQPEHFGVASPGVYEIKLNATHLQSGETGFTSSTPFRLATINFIAAQNGNINLTFDPSQSIISSRASSDQLITPRSVGVYTAGAGTAPTNSPTPTATTVPANTPSPSATSAPTANTPTPSRTPTPTVTTAPGQPTNTPAPTATATPTSNTSSSSSTSPTATPTPTRATTTTTSQTLPTAGNLELTLLILGTGILLFSTGLLLRRV